MTRRSRSNFKGLYWRGYNDQGKKPEEVEKTKLLEYLVEFEASTVFGELITLFIKNWGYFRGFQYATVNEAYESEDETTITIAVGEVVEIYEGGADRGRWSGSVVGKDDVGYFPGSHVKLSAKQPSFVIDTATTATYLKDLAKNMLERDHRLLFHELFL